jgi:hypothetical protein
MGSSRFDDLLELLPGFTGSKQQIVQKNCYECSCPILYIRLRVKH